MSSSAKALCEFVNASPSPFHVVDTAVRRLLANGFKALSERDPWDPKPGDRFFFTRNESTLVAFAVGGKYVSGNGFSIVGAHTDSPNLQLKPVSRVAKGDFLQVGVSTYGGGLWHTWFDRDLTIAGRVLVREGAGVATRLVHVKRPILKIPNLAIHLDRTVSEKFVFNNEDQLVPILSSTFNKPANPEEARDRESKAKHHSALLALIAREIGCEVGAIEDLELSVVDTQPAAIGGIDNDFVFGPRLDNQGMSFCGLEGLVQSMSTLSDCSSIRMLGLFDHEEVGSSSTQGAASSLVLDTLRRITNSMAPAGSHSSDLFERTIRRSFLVSADMAHSLHPNYASKHEANHQPKIGGGVVIKTNVNQRYATSTPTGYVIREVAKRNGVPIQEFVVRNDSPCGSTIGPILASLAGIRAVDIGNPMLGMHSIRETCGAGDVEHAIKLISGFYTDFPSIDNNLKVEVDHK